MLKPDYSNSIVNLMASVIAARGGNLSSYPRLAQLDHAQLSEVRHLVLLVIDGLGHGFLTGLTNGFSKKVENHMHAISLYYMHYNFCKIHKSLRVTPAMEAGVVDTVYNLEFIVKLIDDREPPAKKRGPYKKKVTI